MKLNKTNIAKYYRGLVFDPRKPGTMKVIADMFNPTYCVNRAIEELQTNGGSIDRAIQLLTVAAMLETDV